MPDFCSGKSVDMRNEWISGLRLWAEANGNVRQLWLFGSRARGEARENSDVDIALALIPLTIPPDRRQSIKSNRKVRASTRPIVSLGLAAEFGDRCQ